MAPHAATGPGTQVNVARGEAVGRSAHRPPARRGTTPRLARHGTDEVVRMWRGPPGVCAERPAHRSWATCMQREETRRRPVPTGRDLYERMLAGVRGTRHGLSSWCVNPRAVGGAGGPRIPAHMFEGRESSSGNSSRTSHTCPLRVSLQHPRGGGLSKRQNHAGRSMARPVLESIAADRASDRRKWEGSRLLRGWGWVKQPCGRCSDD